MGLDIRRVPPSEWLYWTYDVGTQRRFLKHLQDISANGFNNEIWQGKPSIAMRDFPDPYPSQRVGSYSAYSIFLLGLEEAVSGMGDEMIESDDEIEREALDEFRKKYRDIRLKIKGASHFLHMPDSDGAFVPAGFDSPFEFEGVWIASLPEAVRALEVFATGLQFDLREPYEEEYIHEKWLPLSTMRNVARILYQFFSETTEKVIMYT